MQKEYANLNQVSISYRVHRVNGTWLPWVTDRSDYAGIYGKNIDELQIQLIGLYNYSVEYSVYVDGRWLLWVIDLNDFEGIYGKAIEGVQIQVIKKQLNI